jgi:hypothetical protein
VTNWIHIFKGRSKLQPYSYISYILCNHYCQQSPWKYARSPYRNILNKTGKQWNWLSCTSIKKSATLQELLNSGTPTGRGNNLRSKRIFWLSKPVRYASVCRRQSAGEAQGGAVRHQTDIRRTTAGLWRCDWWTGSSRADEYSYWTIPSHPRTTEQLYTPSPGDNAVRQATIAYLKNNVTDYNKKSLGFST